MAGMNMTECDECGFTDVRQKGSDCPMCDGGTMTGGS